MPAQSQLGFFGIDEPEQVLPADVPEATELAAALPPDVRFGTSSWTFPGWKGLVYAGEPTTPALIANGLRAYAAHPLFRTVGIDRSYYAPLTETELASYAAQLPPAFPVTCKVWNEATSFTFPNHPSHGERAGKKNPRFLDPRLVIDEILPPYLSAFRDHAGPFLFEMAAVPNLAPAEHDEILRALDRLLDALPDTFRYAFEIRTPALFTARYLDTLRAHGAAHVLSFWTGMPDLRAQMRMPRVSTAPFVLARVMLPPGLPYEDGKAAFAPFDRIVEPQLAMRSDISRLADRCAEAGKPLTILVGNKAEGSAPLTVRALARAIIARRLR